MKKKALVCGAGGFIGGHLVKFLKSKDYWVRGVDIKYHEFSESAADDFIAADLRDPTAATIVTQGIDEVYQLSADMGGAGYIFTGEHDACVMHNSASINLNIAEACRLGGVDKIFYSSSACVYPKSSQLNPENPGLCEDHAYPAEPDSEYGWEKLFSERLYLSYMKNYGVSVRIARLHNIFGPECAWNDGREKAPAAVCRKVAECPDGGEIEIWGDGKQTRSFLYIDECLEGIWRLMHTDFTGPVNLGSDELISINDLVKMVMEIAGKNVNIRHIEGPLGVRGRNSDNTYIKKMLDWRPVKPLHEGMELTYAWIKQQALATDKAIYRN